MARSSLLKMMTVPDVRFYFVAVVLVAVTLCHVSFAQEIPTTTDSSFRTLVQLHVINRHGARTKLSKDADDLTEEGGETLTPLGHKQLYDLGAWLRRTYGEDATSTSTSATTAFLQDYNPALHRLESSDFDRTISSANALSAGLFPRSTRSDLHGGNTDVGLLPADVSPSVPVYSRQSGNDAYLRAYSECPTFHDRLQDLYQSSRWKDLENNEQVDALLRKLGRIFAGDIETVDGAVPLKSIWNAYDEIHVALTECSASNNDGGADGDGTSTTTVLTGPDSFSCISLPNPSLATVLSTTEFAKLEDLMEDTENLKFGVGTAGNLIGSNLLWKMIDRANASEGKFFLYSAHAPTILGLLSTLQADYQADVKERFIEYGSALILEVHEEQQSSRKYIRLKYKSSFRDRAVDISLKQYSDESTVVACGNDDLNTDIDSTASLSSLSFCSLQRFIDWARTATIDSVENWCDACGNDTSDLCMATILKKGEIVDIYDNEPSSSLLTDFRDTAITDPSVIAATFAGGFLSCVLFFGIAYCFCSCRRRKVHKSADGEMIHKDRPDDEKLEAPTAHFNRDDHHETAESNGNDNDQIQNETELL
mmetsp:Transcript_37199/g.90242  ORF Transcript_37199/g.90242 Transcript_37199/m.90242 type:complete len:595 (-) Transcript_37199:1866-3650(-)